MKGERALWAIVVGLLGSALAGLIVLMDKDYHRQQDVLDAVNRAASDISDNELAGYYRRLISGLERIR